MVDGRGVVRGLVGGAVVGRGVVGRAGLLVGEPVGGEVVAGVAGGAVALVLTEGPVGELGVARGLSVRSPSSGPLPHPVASTTTARTATATRRHRRAARVPPAGLLMRPASAADTACGEGRTSRLGPGCENASNRAGVVGVTGGMTLVAGPIPAVTGRGGLAVPARDTADTESAVRELYDVHYARLAGWTARLVGDPDLAHDLATEAFVRLFREFARVDDPRPWLYTVTSNLVRDHWRKRGREAAAYRRHEAGREDVVHDADATTSITVRDAVRALPDRLRLVVLLHYFADLPVATVARQLEKSEGAVKRDLFDARQRMARMLGETR